MQQVNVCPGNWVMDVLVQNPEYVRKAPLPHAAAPAFDGVRPLASHFARLD